ncbi:MAG: GNAT family N-acetyltransferase [Chitinispirillaceae bacterium]|nr:GNAT family N-acetyltransferase [Chitinispirillaceae bacterium]
MNTPTHQPRPQEGVSRQAVTVRQAEPIDRPEIWEFIKNAYGRRAAQKIPARWNWEYRANPFWREERLPVWLAFDNGKIIGQNCAMYVPLKIGSRTIHAAWSVDTIVLSQYRGQGAGSLLQKASSRHHQVFMSLSMSKANRRVKSKIGSMPLPPVTVYRKFLKLTSGAVRLYIQSLEQKQPTKSRLFRLACSIFRVHQLIPFFLNPLIVAYQLLYAMRGKPQPVQIEEIAEFGPEVDTFWEEVRTDYDILVEKNAQYLNWKYVCQPDTRYRLFTAKKGGTVAGFMVVRQFGPGELEFGIIAELFTARSDADTRSVMLRHAEEFFRGRVNYMESAASMREFGETFRSAGFIACEKVAPQFSCAESLADVRAEAVSGTWFLSRGDHDWDAYRPVVAQQEKA